MTGPFHMRSAAAGAVALLLSACAGYNAAGVSAGQTADDVRASMGAETARRALPGGGTRLEYARGPFGKHTYMIDLGPDGRVQRWTQALTEKNFATITPGMPQDDLLLALGQPSHRRSGGWQPGEVWSYRYEAIFCQWFQVSMVDGRVKDAGYGPDPMCDHDDHPSAMLMRPRR